MQHNECKLYVRQLSVCYYYKELWYTFYIHWSQEKSVFLKKIPKKYWIIFVNKHHYLGVSFHNRSSKIKYKVNVCIQLLISNVMGIYFLACLVNCTSSSSKTNTYASYFKPAYMYHIKILTQFILYADKTNKIIVDLNMFHVIDFLTGHAHFDRIYVIHSIRHTYKSVNSQYAM